MAIDTPHAAAAPSEPPAGNHPIPKRLSAELVAVADSIQESEVLLGQLMERMEGRVYTLLLMLLSLPFCQPVTLPGLSMPFGVVIALLGLRFALRQKPWLPEKLWNLSLPGGLLPKILRAGAKMLSWLEKGLHPRWTQVFEFHATSMVAGLIIFTCGLLLLLPLPVPFSNTFPALTVVLIGASMSERDGIMLAVGAGMFLVTLAFFALIAILGAEAWGWLKEFLHGWFSSEPNETGLHIP